MKNIIFSNKLFMFRFTRNCISQEFEETILHYINIISIHIFNNYAV